MAGGDNERDHIRRPTESSGDERSDCLKQCFNSSRGFHRLQPHDPAHDADPESHETDDDEGQNELMTFSGYKGDHASRPLKSSSDERSDCSDESSQNFTPP